MALPELHLCTNYSITLITYVGIICSKVYINLYQTHSISLYDPSLFLVLLVFVTATAHLHPDAVTLEFRHRPILVNVFAGAPSSRSTLCYIVSIGLPFNFIIFFMTNRQKTLMKKNHTYFYDITY